MPKEDVGLKTILSTICRNQNVMATSSLLAKLNFETIYKIVTRSSLGYNTGILRRTEVVNQVMIDNVLTSLLVQR